MGERPTLGISRMTQMTLDDAVAHALTYGGALPSGDCGHQVDAVREVMRSGRWMTPDEVAAESGVALGSVSARMRDLRKAQYGAHVLNKRVRAGHKRLFEYRLIMAFGTEQ